MRVLLPYHLRTLSGAGPEVVLDLGDTPSVNTVLDALEARYPMLRGTIRDPLTRQRRPFLRYFACGLDLSLDSPDAPLPAPVALGTEPLRIVGAMAGG